MFWSAATFLTLLITKGKAKRTAITTAATTRIVVTVRAAGICERMLLG